MELNISGIIGITLILLAIVLLALWVCTDHKYKYWASFVALIVIFIGIFFTVQDRATEITINKVGTIKAAADQAKIDAHAISDLRKRIEAQSATVDLVAESATKANNLIEELVKKNEQADDKIKKLERAGDDIQKALDNLTETADFMYAVATAQIDDRQAFNRLVEWSHKKDSQFRLQANEALIKIRSNYMGYTATANVVLPIPNDQTSKYSIEKFKSIYKNSDRAYNADIINRIHRSTVIDKKDKMSFYIDVLKHDNSLLATAFAGSHFVDLANDNLEWVPFLTEPLIEWWDKNQNNISQLN